MGHFLGGFFSRHIMNTLIKINAQRSWQKLKLWKLKLKFLDWIYYTLLLRLFKFSFCASFSVLRDIPTRKINSYSPRGLIDIAEHYARHSLSLEHVNSHRINDFIADNKTKQALSSISVISSMKLPARLLIVALNTWGKSCLFMFS